MLTTSAWSCFRRHPGWVHRRDSGLSVLYDIWLWHKLRAKNGFQSIDYDIFSIQIPTISFGVRDFEPAILGSKTARFFFFQKESILDWRSYHLDTSNHLGSTADTLDIHPRKLTAGTPKKMNSLG